MSLWGVSTIISGTSSNADSGATPQKRTKPEDRAEAKPKRARGQKTSGGGIVLGLPSADSQSETSSQAGVGGLSSSWMFGAKLSTKATKSKGSEHCRDFDATEKVISQVESVKATLANPSQFLGLTYAKCQSVLEKICARNTEPLQKIYRESCQSGDALHGLELLKRTVAAEHQARSMLDFVAALHDAEASAETFEAAATEARNQGVTLPSCVDKLSYARKCKELAKQKDWKGYFQSLEKDNLKVIFVDEEEANLLDFQASSMSATLSSLLMEEVKIETSTPDGKQMDEKEIKVAKDAECARLAHDVHTCLVSFEESLHSAWKGHQIVGQLDDDLVKLLNLTSALLKEEASLTGPDIEELKASRLAVVGNKKGSLHETLTLFPVGMFIQQSVNEICTRYFHDQGLIAELEKVVELVDALKTTFTGDALLKEKAVGDAKEFEIQIPSQAKLFDIVAKLLEYR